MKSVLCLSLTLLAIGLIAQTPQQDFKVRKPKEVKQSGGKVTADEAGRTFQKLIDTLAKGPKLKAGSAVTLPKGSTIIKKSEVLKVFVDIERSYTAFYKRAPRPYRFDPKRVASFVSADAQRLITRGFLPPYTAITIGKDDGLTTKEFGDSVGIFMVRLSDLAHLPDPKFSPQLMPGN